jgi:hypothetical protein
VSADEAGAAGDGDRVAWSRGLQVAEVGEVSCERVVGLAGDVSGHAPPDPTTPLMSGRGRAPGPTGPRNDTRNGLRPDLPTTAEREEIRKLRAEVFELRRANEILKSASVFFGAPG